MKDYSFGDSIYQRDFILSYDFTDDYKNIITYLANGEIKYFVNNPKNLKRILTKMRNQINRASNVLDQLSVDHNKISLQEYISIKLKAKDIKKNKLFLENLNRINNLITDTNSNWKLQLSGKLAYILVGRTHPLSLRDADDFSSKNIKKLINIMDKKSKGY